MDLVSIIIPVFNLENKLKRCVDSVLRQTYGRTQIILVDDGSTDKSAEICRRFAEQDDRVCFLQKPNGGVSSARNLGLEHADGTFVMFVDGDDSVSADFVERYVAAIQETRSDVVIGGLTFLEGVQETVRAPEKGVYNRQAFFELLCKNGTELYGYACNRIYTLDLILRAKIRFDEEMHSQEDLAFALRAYHAAEHIACIDFVGYLYEYSPGMRSFPPEHLFGNQISLFRYAKEAGADTEPMIPRFQSLLFTALYHADSEKMIRRIGQIEIPEELLTRCKENRLEVHRIIALFAAQKYGRIYHYFRVRNGIRKLAGRTQAVN